MAASSGVSLFFVDTKLCLFSFQFLHVFLTCLTMKSGRVTHFSPCPFLSSHLFFLSSLPPSPPLRLSTEQHNKCTAKIIVYCMLFFFVFLQLDTEKHDGAFSFILTSRTKWGLRVKFRFFFCCALLPRFYGNEKLWNCFFFVCRVQKKEIAVFVFFI